MCSPTCCLILFLLDCSPPGEHCPVHQVPGYHRSLQGKEPPLHTGALVSAPSSGLFPSFCCQPAASTLCRYQKPLLTSALYTDLSTGAWHAISYTIALAVWTLATVSTRTLDSFSWDQNIRPNPLQAVFDAYCLDQASPGASHTGFYLFSFDFVYVGNHHVRNLIMFCSLVSAIASLVLLATSCLTLNALR